MIIYQGWTFRGRWFSSNPGKHFWELIFRESSMTYPSRLRLLKNYFWIFIHKKTKIEDDYQGIKSELHSKNQPHLFQLAVKEKNITNGLKQNSSSTINFSECPKYAYELLVKPVEELPSDVLNESREVKEILTEKWKGLIIFKNFTH